MIEPGMDLRAARHRDALHRRRRLAVAIGVSSTLHAASLFAVVPLWVDREKAEVPRPVIAVERLWIEENRPSDDARLDAEMDVWVEHEASARQAGRALRAGAEASQLSHDSRPMKAVNSDTPRVDRTEPSRPNKHSRPVSDLAALASNSLAGAPEEKDLIQDGLFPRPLESQMLADGEWGSDVSVKKATAEKQDRMMQILELVRNDSSLDGLESDSSLSDASVEALPGEQEPRIGEKQDYMDFAEVARLRARQASLDIYLLEVRRRVEPHWKPRFVLRGNRSKRDVEAMLGDRNQILTRVAVRLDSRGRVSEVKVNGSSGLVQLDEHAVEAFRNAAPFPPPPRHLLEEGELAFQWGARADRARVSNR